MSKVKVKIKNSLTDSPKFRSGFEERVGKCLDDEGISYEYESLVIYYKEPEKNRKYIPDFILKSGGKVILVETKGELTLPDRKKHVQLKLQFPDLDIRFVFQNSNNKIRKGSKTTYADWADKNEIPWATHRVPKEWLKELE